MFEDEVVNTAMAGVSADADEDESAVSTGADEDAELDEAGEGEGADDGTADESATSGENEGEQNGQPRKKGGFQRRIDKLTTRISQTEADAAYWRAKALEREVEQGKQAQQPEKVDVPVPADDPEPDPEKFSTTREYIKAQAQWEARQIVRQDRAQDKARTEAAAKASEQQTAAQKFNERVGEFKKAHGDFDEVVRNPNLPITEHMLTLMMHSDMGADVVYYLGKNPAIAAKIARMSGNEVAIAIGRIEGRLASTKTTDTARRATSTTEPPRPAVTKAPAPPAQVRKPAPASARVDLNDPNVPMDKWVKAHEEHMRKRRG